METNNNNNNESKMKITEIKLTKEEKKKNHVTDHRTIGEHGRYMRNRFVATDGRVFEIFAISGSDYKNGYSMWLGTVNWTAFMLTINGKDFGDYDRKKDAMEEMKNQVEK